MRAPTTYLGMYGTVSVLLCVRLGLITGRLDLASHPKTSLAASAQLQQAPAGHTLAASNNQYLSRTSTKPDRPIHPPHPYSTSWDNPPPAYNLEVQVPGLALSFSLGLTWAALHCTLPPSALSVGPPAGKEPNLSFSIRPSQTNPLHFLSTCSAHFFNSPPSPSSQSSFASVAWSFAPCRSSFLLRSFDSLTLPYSPNAARARNNNPPRPSSVSEQDQGNSSEQIV